MQVKSHSGRNHHDQAQSSPSSAYIVVGLQMSDAFYLFLRVVDKITFVIVEVDIRHFSCMDERMT